MNDDLSSIDVFELIQRNLPVLRQNMPAQPPLFDSNKCYPQKNYYFNQVNDEGLYHLLRQGRTVDAEIYFKRMLDEIQQYENENNKHLNKGMVYANLGIAQIRQGKFDYGIANFLTAEREDKDDFKRTLADWNILDTPMWDQFEREIIQFVLSHIQSFNQTPSFLTEDLVASFLKGMEQQDRIFCETTLQAIEISFNQNKNCSNAYSRGRLYSGIKDLCLLAEPLIRRKRLKDGKSLGENLYTLLQLVFKDEKKVFQPKYPKAETLQIFLEYLEILINETQDPELIYSYILYLTRNFAGHHFDPSENEVSPSGKTFFDLYPEMLSNVLCAMLYLKHISAI